MLRDRIHERVEKRLRRRNHLFIHLALTLVFILLTTALIDLFGLPPQVEDTVIPAVVLLFVARALWFVYQESGAVILRQETEHYDDMDEKPKPYLAVGDDGELIEILSDDDKWDDKPKRAE